VERGYSPQIAPGTWLRFGVERGSLGAELRGGWHATTSASSSNGRVDLWQLAVDLRGCVRGDARLAASLCLGLRAARLAARGQGLAEGY
jgi:hypothetical protein